MSTKIEWALNADGSQGETWNPIRAGLIDGYLNASITGKLGTGCTKVSPGCLNCYAGTMNRRFYGNDYSYKSRPEGWTIDEKILELPARMKKPTTFFVASMCDLFHEGIPYPLIYEVFTVMKSFPQHLFLVLTKRPMKMRTVIAAVGSQTIPFPNVWLGVSAENQEMANERIPILLDIPAAKRFVSCEPLLGPVSLDKFLRCSGCGYTNTDKGIHHDHHLCTSPSQTIDWVIVGGESGPKARPMHPEWARSLRDQCDQAWVPFFFKQWGNWRPLGDFYSETTDVALSTVDESRSEIIDRCGGIHKESHGQPLPGSYVMECAGKKKAGRLLDGVEYNQMPERNS